MIFDKLPSCIGPYDVHTSKKSDHILFSQNIKSVRHFTPDEIKLIAEIALVGNGDECLITFKSKLRPRYIKFYPRVHFDNDKNDQRIDPFKAIVVTQTTYEGDEYTLIIEDKAIDITSFLTDTTPFFNKLPSKWHKKISSIIKGLGQIVMGMGGCLFLVGLVALYIVVQEFIFSFDAVLYILGGILLLIVCGSVISLAVVIAVGWSGEEGKDFWSVIRIILFTIIILGVFGYILYLLYAFFHFFFSPRP